MVVGVMASQLGVFSGVRDPTKCTSSLQLSSSLNAVGASRRPEALALPLKQRRLEFWIGWLQSVACRCDVRRKSALQFPAKLPEAVAHFCENAPTRPEGKRRTDTLRMYEIFTGAVVQFCENAPATPVFFCSSSSPQSCRCLRLLSL